MVNHALQHPTGVTPVELPAINSVPDQAVLGVEVRSIVGMDHGAAGAATPVQGRGASRLPYNPSSWQPACPLKIAYSK